MLNQRKLLVSLVTSLLFVVAVTVVTADDTVSGTETAAQDTGVALCLEESDFQEEVPLSDATAMISEEPKKEEEKETIH